MGTRPFPLQGREIFGTSNTRIIMKTLAIAFCSLSFTLGFLPGPALADGPFNGKTLQGWSFKKKGTLQPKWVTGTPKLAADNPKALVADGTGGAMVNVVTGHGQSIDIYSDQKWGSCRIELEVLVAKGANSGIYVMGEYEVQVLDSYGKEKLGGGDMGAIYGAQPPRTNACKKPGEWQKYEIDFLAPGFDAAGKKTSNARFLVVKLNGKVLHENVEMKGPTPSGVTGREAATGPIMFQGDHGPVAYRNIRITPLKK
jgi:hypothetical protein|tara:strand:+ start:3016 stop:3783 length:768 start_codon:yes stop_codon:yes gene_type:complete